MDKTAVKDSCRGPAGPRVSLGGEVCEGKDSSRAMGEGRCCRAGGSRASGNSLQSDSVPKSVPAHSYQHKYFQLADRAGSDLNKHL